MEKDNAEVFEIDLLDLWRVFVRRVWIILLVMVICAVAYFACDRATFVPQYESTATMYILRQGKDTESYAEQFASQLNTNFTLAMNVVTDCTYLLQDRKVVDQVIEDLKLDMTYDELSQAITITNPTDTRILKVQVKAESPKKAQKIVNKLCTVGADGIRDAMGIGQANFYEKGVYNPKPCNQTPKSRYLMVALIAALLTYMYFVVRFLLDDGIHSEEDVEKYLGLTVLAEIPDINGDNNRGRYGGKYGRYGYGYGAQYGNRVTDSFSAPGRDSVSGTVGIDGYASADPQDDPASQAAGYGNTAVSENADYGYSDASWAPQTGYIEESTDGTGLDAGSDAAYDGNAMESAGWTDEEPVLDDYSRFAPPAETEAPAGMQDDSAEDEGRQ